MAASVTPLSAFETRLVQAFRQEHTQLAHWTSKGRPDRNHKILIELYATLLDVLAAHGIEYWLEFGSFLGYVRHRGIFPWEYDMDIGVTQDEFENLQRNVAPLFENDPNWGFKWHEYDDWQGHPDYVFYSKRHADIFCDVTIYSVVDDRLECRVKEWNYPSYVTLDVLPPRRVMMFGRPALIPARPNAVLGVVESILGQHTNLGADQVNKVKWFHYDPVPFLLCSLYNPRFTPLLCTYCMQDVAEGKDFGGQTTNCAAARVVRAQDGAADVFGGLGGSVTEISCLPRGNASPNDAFVLNDSAKVCLAVRGSAAYMFMDVKDFDVLRGVDPTGTLPVWELLYANEHALWGKVWQVWQHEGDVLFVPRGVAVRRTHYGDFVSREVSLE